ncbi:hypothetical protein D3C87_278480 [compost metagenome]
MNTSLHTMTKPTVKTYTRDEVQKWRDDIAYACAVIAKLAGIDPILEENMRQLAKNPPECYVIAKYEFRLLGREGAHWLECTKECHENHAPDIETRILYEKVNHG